MAAKRDKLDTHLLSDKAQFTYAKRTKHAVSSDASTYRTVITATTQESEAIGIIGAYLFHFKLIDWGTILDDLTMKERKARLTPSIGARYAYSILVQNNAQYDLQKRNIKANIELLKSEIKELEKRQQQAKDWRLKHPDIVDDNGRKPRKKDYNPLSYDENGRLQHDRALLESYRRNDDWYDVTFGGKHKHKRVMRAIAKNEENANGMLRDFMLSRYSIYALGESATKYGNNVVQVDLDGHLRIRIPDAIQDKVMLIMGWDNPKKHLTISTPVRFSYGADAVMMNISENLCTTHKITYANGEWVLSTTINSTSQMNKDASEACLNGGAWTQDDGSRTFATGTDNPAVSARNAARERKKAIERDVVSADINRDECAAKRARYAGIDVNANHIDVSFCDAYGNPVGRPLTIPYKMSANEKQTKSSVLHALDRVKYACEQRKVVTVFMEDLNGFIGSQTRVLNSGGRDFRRCVSSIPTGLFKEWAVRKLSSASCHVEFVAAAYTSKCADAYWSDLFSSTHQGAALMVARRGLGLGLYRHVPVSPSSSSEKAMECSQANCGTSESMANNGGAVALSGAIMGGDDVSVPSSVNDERFKCKDSHLDSHQRILRRRHIVASSPSFAHFTVQSEWHKTP